jgi:hypothetical protein
MLPSGGDVLRMDFAPDWNEILADLHPIAALPGRCARHPIRGQPIRPPALVAPTV